VVVHVEFVIRGEPHCFYKLLLRDCVIDLCREETEACVVSLMLRKGEGMGARRPSVA
jgi:hypothetical protein